VVEGGAFEQVADLAGLVGIESFEDDAAGDKDVVAWYDLRQRGGQGTEVTFRAANDGAVSVDGQHESGI
jgi:hypothetical protein